MDLDPPGSFEGDPHPPSIPSLSGRCSEMPTKIKKFLLINRLIFPIRTSYLKFAPKVSSTLGSVDDDFGAIDLLAQYQAKIFYLDS